MSFTVNERRKWSVMGSSSAVTSRGVTPEQQIQNVSFGVCGNSGMLLTSKTFQAGCEVLGEKQVGIAHVYI